MSKNREKAFYEAAKKGCVLVSSEGREELGRVTWNADYTFGWIPRDGVEQMVFKGPGLRIIPEDPPGSSAVRGQRCDGQRSKGSSKTTDSTGSRRGTFSG